MSTVEVDTTKDELERSLREDAEEVEVRLDAFRERLAEVMGSIARLATADGGSAA